MSETTASAESFEPAGARMIFLRHAEARSTIQAPDESIIADAADELTTHGREQAVAVGRWLSALSSSLVLFSSPLRRARETAEIISEIVSTPIKWEESLKEREFNFKLEITVARAAELQEHAYEFPERQVEGGESVRAHRGRVYEWLANYKSSLVPGTTYVVICHGGVIEQLQGCMYGVAMDQDALVCTKCDSAHFHLWSTFRTHSGRTVWCLEGINIDPTLEYGAV